MQFRILDADDLLRGLDADVDDGEELAHAVSDMVQPDFDALLRVENTLSWRGVIVTSRGTGRDFVSRYFAPWMGVNEDPVTGSAHTVLAPYWAERLGKHVMTAYQASERGGELGVELTGERVLITGRSVLVVEGKLFY